MMLCPHCGMAKRAPRVAVLTSSSESETSDDELSFSRASAEVRANATRHRGVTWITSRAPLPPVVRPGHPSLPIWATESAVRNHLAACRSPDARVACDTAIELRGRRNSCFYSAPFTPGLEACSVRSCHDIMGRFTPGIVASFATACLQLLPCPAAKLWTTNGLAPVSAQLDDHQQRDHVIVSSDADGYFLLCVQQHAATTGVYVRLVSTVPAVSASRQILARKLTENLSRECGWEAEVFEWLDPIVNAVSSTSLDSGAATCTSALRLLLGRSPCFVDEHDSPAHKDGCIFLVRLLVLLCAVETGRPGDHHFIELEDLTWI